MPAGIYRQPELGADAIGGADENGIVISGRAQIEKAAETAESAKRPAACGRRGERLYGVDQRIAGFNVDTGILVADCDGRLRAAR